MPGESLYVITPADRTTLLQGPLGAILMLGGDRTGGSLSLVEHPLQPRALGSPVHTHRHEDEYSVVLEGQVGAQIGEQTVVAGPVGRIPEGVRHPARLLEIISPAGFEGYFAGLGEIFTGQGPPDAGRLAELRDRYGLDLDLASVPRLAAAHGLLVPGAPPGTP